VFVYIFKLKSSFYCKNVCFINSTNCVYNADDAVDTYKAIFDRMSMIFVLLLCLLCVLQNMSINHTVDVSDGQSKWYRPDLPSKCTYKIGETPVSKSPHRHVTRLAVGYMPSLSVW